MGEKRQSVVLLFKRSTYKSLDLDLDEEVSKLESHDLDLKIVECESPKDVLSQLSDSVGILTWHTTLNFSEEVLGSLPKCRVLGTYSVGVDHIDIDSATGNNIAVINVPTSPEVADHAITLILALQRKLYQYVVAVKNNEWDESVGKPLFRIESQLLGLLGFGEIARQLSQKAVDLGYQVIAHDPYVSDDLFSSYEIRPVEFDELVESSDILSVHLPLTEETRGMIGVDQLKKMKETSFLVNTSRGKVLDEEALYSALDKGEIAGAALDVMSNEPPDTQNPLLELDNVLITPHVAWYTEQACTDYRRSLFDGVLAVLRGEKPDNLVNVAVDIGGK